MNDLSKSESRRFRYGVLCVAACSVSLAIEQRLDVFVPTRIKWTNGTTYIELDSTYDWLASGLVFLLSISVWWLLHKNESRLWRWWRVGIGLLSSLIGLALCASLLGEVPGSVFAHRLQGLSVGGGANVVPSVVGTVFVDSPTRSWQQMHWLIRLRLDPTFSIMIVVYVAFLLLSMRSLALALQPTRSEATVCTCGYDLTGLVEQSNCPECGHSIAIGKLRRE